MAAVLEKQSSADAATGLVAIAAGAPVVTLDGVMPIEFLEPGDRIVTRSGVRALVSLQTQMYSGEAMVVVGGSLGHCLPGENTFLTPDTRVVVRDWRAQSLFGMDAALVAIDALEDGEFVRRVQVIDLPMFTLVLEQDDVVYAGGMELSVTQSVPAYA